MALTFELVLNGWPSPSSLERGVRVRALLCSNHIEPWETDYELGCLVLSSLYYQTCHVWSVLILSNILQHAMCLSICITDVGLAQSTSEGGLKTAFSRFGGVSRGEFFYSAVLYVLHLLNLEDNQSAYFCIIC